MIGKTNTLTIFIMAILVSLIIQPVSAGVTTGAVEINASTYCAKFQGTADGATTIAWFEYGINQSTNPFSEGGAKSFKTNNKTVVGAFNQTVCGLPLVSNTTYVVQAGGVDGSDIVYGDNVSFVFPVVTPHVTTTYEVYVNTFLEDAESDPVKIVTTDVWIVYTMTLSAIVFFGIVIGMTFMNMVTKQRTVAMAVLVVLLTGTSIWAFFPPEYIMFVEILFLLGIGGMFYWWFMRRR